MDRQPEEPLRPHTSLFPRAVLAFAALPGVVAFVVPFLLAPAGGEHRAWQRIGLVFIAAGTGLLLWCVRDFYVTGKGTLAPWSPPRRLTTVGLYRRSRNPMYVSVCTVLVGWSAWHASPLLLAYAVGIAVAFHLRVVLYEEPWLERTFGGAWRHYRATVRRYL